MKYECNNCKTAKESGISCLQVIPGNIIFKRYYCICDGSLNAIFKPVEPTVSFIQQKLINWLENGESGASSMSLWYLLMGIEVTRLHTPYDSDDFLRCYNLLKLVDESTKRSILFKAGSIEPMWKSFSCAWTFLETLYKDSKIIELERAINKLRE